MPAGSRLALATRIDGDRVRLVVLGDFVASQRPIRRRDGVRRVHAGAVRGDPVRASRLAVRKPAAGRCTFRRENVPGVCFRPAVAHDSVSASRWCISSIAALLLQDGECHLWRVGSSRAVIERGSVLGRGGNTPAIALEPTSREFAIAWSATPAVGGVAGARFSYPGDAISGRYGSSCSASSFDFSTDPPPGRSSSDSRSAGGRRHAVRAGVVVRGRCDAARRDRHERLRAQREPRRAPRPAGAGRRVWARAVARAQSGRGRHQPRASHPGG